MESRKHKNNTVREIEHWAVTFSTSLYQRAYFLTSHHETAEDLVQDTFLAAVQQAHAFEHKSSPKTWLFSILHHKAADFFRKKYQYRKTLTIDFLSGEGSDVTGSPSLSYWQDDADHVLDDPSFRRALQHCLDGLPGLWRSVFLMKFMEGKKGEDICQVLNLSKSNYWQILHRTRVHLRGHLQQHWIKH